MASLREFPEPIMRKPDFCIYVKTKAHMSLVVRKPVFGVSDQVTNPPVQSLNMARGLKFRIQKVEGLYYPCSENRGADQLRGHCEADLCLCFRIMQKAGYLTTRLICISCAVTTQLISAFFFCYMDKSLV